jgi:hypothetical protein
MECNVIQRRKYARRCTIQATELSGAVKVVCHKSQATAVIEDTERGEPGCGQFSANKHVDCIPTSAMPSKPARLVGHVFF